MDNGPTRLNEFLTLGGEIEINTKSRAKNFADNFEKFIDTFTEINNFVSKKVKDIQGKAHDLADDMYAVGSEIQRLSALFKSVDIPQIVLLYDRLG